MELYQTAEKKHGRRAVTVVLVILAVLIAAVGVLSWMLLSDPNAGRGLEKISPTDALAKKVMTSAALKKEAGFSADDMNGYLAFLFQNSNAAKKDGNIKLEAIAVSGTSGNNADIYLPVTYQGKHFGVVLNVTPSIDAANNKLIFQVNSAQVGRLPMPVGWVLEKAKSHLPEGFSLSGNQITCETPSVGVTLSGISASLKLSDFHMENGLLQIGAKTEIRIG